MPTNETDPIEVLRATPVRVASLLHDRRFDADDDADPDASAGGAVIAHLADREIRFAFQARQAVAATYRPEDGAYRSEPIDVSAWARDYDRLDPSLAAEAFMALRGWNLAWLARLDLADWLAPCHDPDGVGGETIDELVRSVADHDVAALARLETLAGD